jgi:hypothetical protein
MSLQHPAHECKIETDKKHTDRKKYIIVMIKYLRIDEAQLTQNAEIQTKKAQKR